MSWKDKNSLPSKVGVPMHPAQSLGAIQQSHCEQLLLDRTSLEGKEAVAAQTNLSGRQWLSLVRRHSRLGSVSMERISLPRRIPNLLRMAVYLFELPISF